eukprot:3261572-Rhodomonas_salina.1
MGGLTYKDGRAGIQSTLATRSQTCTWDRSVTHVKCYPLFVPSTSASTDMALPAYPLSFRCRSDVVVNPHACTGSK